MDDVSLGNLVFLMNVRVKNVNVDDNKILRNKVHSCLHKCFQPYTLNSVGD